MPGSSIIVRTVLLVILAAVPGVASAQETKPSHLVKLSDLKVLSAASAGPLVEFTVLLFDEKGDVGDPNDLTFEYYLYCGGGQITIGHAYGKAAPKEPKQSIVRATTGKTPGFSAAGTCDLKVSFKDVEGIESNSLTAKVEFKG